MLYGFSPTTPTRLLDPQADATPVAVSLRPVALWLAEAVPQNVIIHVLFCRVPSETGAELLPA